MFNAIAYAAALEYLKRFSQGVDLFHRHGLPMNVEDEDERLFLMAIEILNLTSGKI